ncbi:MAG TPA: transcription-repair coupling factor [candidate division Zixibacteria bacterium]|nr:transcription-repair coupling factor [candidate division Zixibacteria bacterium]
MDSSSLKRTLEEFLQGSWRGVRRIQGLQGGASAYVLALIAAVQRRTMLVVAPTPSSAENLYHDLAFFLGEEPSLNPLRKRLHLLPPWEVLPFEKLSPHPESVAGRLEALYRLVEEPASILVSTPSALMQKMLPRDAFKTSYRYLVPGDELPREALIEHLAHWGFQNVPLVEERGDFSVRGGIVDLFAPGYGRPLRLEFEGDRLESIREFNPANQRSERPHEEALILPMKEFSLKRAGLDEVARKLGQRAMELDLDRLEQGRLLESLKQGIAFPGIEFLLPYFYPELVALFSYLPADSLVVALGFDRVEAEAERFAELARERNARAREEGRLVPAADALYLDERQWREELAAFSRLHCESLAVLGGPEPTLTVDSFLTGTLQRESAARHGRDPSLAPLVERLREQPEERIFFVAPTEADARRLIELFGHYDFHVTLSSDPVPLLLEGGRRGPTATLGRLNQGFRLPSSGLAFLTFDEIFGTQKRRAAPPKKAHPSHFLTSLSELKQDDYVVHLDHGIGIYRGLKFLQVAGVEGEFLHLEYEGGDRLYVPVDRINVVQKYIGTEGAKPSLDRLGGTSWEKVKARTRKSVLAMAEELVKLYAIREARSGTAFPPPDSLYREFEAGFEYEETPDQQRAIDETLAGMQRPKPMDRLICGDVGYGKTEVAMRAAFLAVEAGKQVAVLVPTTILAQQHLQTFRHRFRTHAVRIEMISRFLRTKEIAAILQDTARGKVDILIGTHRLLQKDVEFKDLGLVIIDEEHRFGVAHKERLKKLRQLVDVVSLTATPIPRTLHMSLVGIRDLSIIETPPADRLAIQTYVTRYDEALIRDAILRELERGGQVFFLHNRVETIDRVALKLQEIVPEAKLAVAHGQMRPRDLERVMLDFLENRTQVLVCSAIIESGLDFPNANTIIVNRADKFGLAQLYQLRGRVGRSHRHAYAYLLIPGEKAITPEAEKRLRALQELDGLGGGFKLALHDLEIRGAGNLLGAEQSGQIAAVGFELYTEMMRDAVRELKGEAVVPEVEPEIRLGIPAYFPDDYIPDVSQRLYFYKRLASLRSSEELEELKEEIRDRYGPYGEPVENLFLIMELRRLLRQHLVQQISVSDGKVFLLFHPQSPVRVEKLLELIRAPRGGYRLTPNGRLSFTPLHRDGKRLVAEVAELLASLQPTPGEEPKALETGRGVGGGGP